MIDNLSITVHAFPMSMLTWLSVEEILLPRYLNLSTNFRGVSFNVEMAHHLIQNTRTLFYLSSRRDQCFLLPAPGSTVEIQLGHVYFIRAKWLFCGFVNFITTQKTLQKYLQKLLLKT